MQRNLKKEDIQKIEDVCKFLLRREVKMAKTVCKKENFEMKNTNIINTIVELKDGRKGKVIGQLESGEYMLASGKGGQITYFTENDMDC